jgi:hypothetical protein
MSRTFFESSSSSGFREPEPAVLCAPRPRRVQVHPCSADLILGPPPFLLNIITKKKEGKAKAPEVETGDEDVGWALFGGSPPARADNPLVHDPHFLRNQRHQLPDELGIFDHLSSHRPTYSSGGNNTNFALSFAPAVRVQGFDVASCRSTHSNGGGRVLSARA